MSIPRSSVASRGGRHGPPTTARRSIDPEHRAPSYLGGVRMTPLRDRGLGSGPAGPRAVLRRLIETSEALARNRCPRALPQGRTHDEVRGESHVARSCRIPPKTARENTLARSLSPDAVGLHDLGPPHARIRPLLRVGEVDLAMVRVAARSAEVEASPDAGRARRAGAGPAVGVLRRMPGSTTSCPAGAGPSPTVALLTDRPCGCLQRSANASAAGMTGEAVGPVSPRSM